MYEKRPPMPSEQLENALERLDLAQVPAEYRERAAALAETFATTLIGLTHSVLGANFDIGAHQLSISRSLFMWNQLSLVSTPALAVFWFGFLDWIVELIQSLFDDEGVDVAVGTVETPEGTPTHAGAGIEINIDSGEDEGEEEEPEPQPFPFEFEPPPKEPDIQIKVMGIFDLDNVLDDLSGLPPAGLDAFSFPVPDLEPGDAGIFVGIEFKF